MLEAQQVCKHFGFYPVLKQLNLSLAGGQWLGVLGHNGAGKSTLLRVLAGLCSLDAGQLVWHGELEQTLNRRKRLAVLFENNHLYPSLSAVQNLRFFFELYNEPRTTQQLLGALQNWGLKGFEHWPVHQLSAGLQKRVALARLELKNPALLLLDEPYNSLDPATTEQFNLFLKQKVQQKASVLMVSHQWATCAQWVDQWWCMQQGQLCSVASPIQ